MKNGDLRKGWSEGRAEILYWPNSGTQNRTQMNLYSFDLRGEVKCDKMCAAPKPHYFLHMFSLDVPATYLKLPQVSILRVIWVRKGWEEKYEDFFQTEKIHKMD